MEAPLNERGRRVQPIADTEAKKILGTLWASGGDRTDPDDSSLTPVLTRDTGWPSSFSATDGDTARRRVVNQRFRELDGAASDLYRYGGLQPYDDEIDYLQYARCFVQGQEYYASAANGPGSTVVGPTDAGQTTWVAVSGTIGAPSAPPAPTATTPRSGELVWFWACPLDGGSIITEFDLQWRVSGMTAWSASVVLDTPRHEQTGLTNGVAIQVRVLARNAEGDSPWSSTGSATPQGEVPGGGATLALRTDAGDAEIDADWLEPDDGGVNITSYILQWAGSGQNFSTGRQRTVLTTEDTIPNLTNGTAYRVRVRAVNGQGEGAWSNESPATPVAEVVDPTPPADTAPDAPDSPDRDVIDHETILWSWSFPDDDGGSPITGYDIQRRVQGAGWSGGIVSQTESCYLDEGRSPSTIYEARVRARNSVGNSGWSSDTPATTPAAPVDPTPPADTAPDAPDAPDRDVIDHETILWSWTFPDDDGGSPITGYDIQTRLDGAGWSGGIVALTESCYLHEGRAASTTYEARVRARNSVGNSGWSSDTPATTPAAPVGNTVPGRGRRSDRDRRAERDRLDDRSAERQRIGHHRIPNPHTGNRRGLVEHHGGSHAAGLRRDRADQRG